MVTIRSPLEGKSRSFRIACLVFCCANGLLMVRQSVPFGLGISPDSIAYINMARSLMVNGFADLFGNTGVTYPLGYPAVLAGAGWLTNTDPLEAAIFVNGIIAVLLVFFFMLEADRLPGVSPWLSGFIITFSLTLSRMSAMAWSEMLFTFVVFMTLRKAASFDQRPWSLVLLGIMTFCAYLTKYIGVTLIPVVMVQVFLCTRGEIWKRLRNTAIYLAVTCGLVGTYTLRNYLVSGTFWSNRPPSQTSIWASLSQTRGTLVAWFFPEIPQTWFFLWGLALIAAVYLWWTRHHILRNSRDHAHWFAVYPAFILVNLSVLNFTASRYAFDGLGFRLLAPVYPALALTLLFLIASGKSKESTPNLTRAGHWFLVLVLIAQPFRLVLKDTHRRGRDGGGGYNRPMWRNSHMINECLPQLDLTGETVFSNNPNVLYIMAGINAKAIPQKRANLTKLPSGVSAENIFDRYPRFKGSLLILFDDIGNRREYLFSREEMEEMCQLEQLMVCQDAVVFRVHGPQVD